MQSKVIELICTKSVQQDRKVSFLEWGVWSELVLGFLSKTGVGHPNTYMKGGK